MKVKTKDLLISIDEIEVENTPYNNRQIEDAKLSWKHVMEALRDYKHYTDRLKNVAK